MPFHPVKFQIDWQKRLRVRVQKRNFKTAVMVAILFFQIATGLQFYDVIADPKVGEEYISTKYSKRNSFQVTTDLHNSENLKIAIAQLCNEQ